MIKKSIRPQTDRRWTLLFIGDHGNVITLKRFKAMVIAAGALFFLMVAGLLVLIVIHQKTFRQNKDLQQRVQHSQQRMETLRHEKEILMARLVLAESNAKKNAAGKRSQKQKPTGAAAAGSQPQMASKPESTLQSHKKAPVAPKAQPKPAASPAGEVEPVMRVAVESFRVARESDNQNLSAQFKIKNTSTGVSRVAGHAVVVLSGADLQKDQWLVMPAVRLAGDKPSGKRGKKFSIQRFRTMQFTSREPKYSDQFQKAAVYVFASNGQLLLETEFAVKLPPLPVVAADTPSGEKPTRDTQPAEPALRPKPAPATPPGEASSAESSPSEVPPAESPPSEAPASDDLMDSQDSAMEVF